MKATILYCDRCHAEGKEHAPAQFVVWIKTGGMPRAIRVDACLAHYAAITGQSNGAQPTVATAPEPAEQSMPAFSKRGGSGLYQRRLEQILAYAAKHPRFTRPDLERLFGKDSTTAQIGTPMKLLVDAGKIERYMQGIYQRPGYTIPEPPNVDAAVAASMKLIRAQPGIRGPMVAALAGVSSHKLWKAALYLMRDQKMIRTKGEKTGMQMFPV